MAELRLDVAEVGHHQSVPRRAVHLLERADHRELSVGDLYAVLGEAKPHQLVELLLVEHGSLSSLGPRVAGYRPIVS